MLSIHTVVGLTRRRTISQVLDENGEVQFSSISAIECISYIEAQGQTSMALQDDDFVWWIQLIGWDKAPEKGEPPKPPEDLQTMISAG